MIARYYLAIDQIAQSGLSSLKVNYYSAQLFRLHTLCQIYSLLMITNNQDTREKNMKRFFSKNKFKEVDEKISDGDLIFGLVVVIKEIQLHIIKNNDFRYVIQADLTNDIWNYADTRFLMKRSNERVLGFFNYISTHHKYNVAALFVSNTFKNRINVFKKTSKCGLEYQLLILKRKVHFFIDQLDLFAIANKSEGFGKSVTASELRWLYRHRYMPDVQNNLMFWNNYKVISSDYVFSMPLWRAYTPNNTCK